MRTFILGKQIGFLERIVFIFVIPLIFTWLMFNPFTEISLKANTNEPQFISKSQIDKDLTSSFLAEFFQTSLQLGWYQICFENHGALKMGGQTVVNRKDRGSVQIQVREVLPSPYTAKYDVLDARPFEDPDCMRIGSGIDGINVGTSTVGLGARINDRPGDFVMLNDGGFEMNFDVDFTKMDLYIKQDWVAFLVKYLVMVILWSSLVLLSRSIWKFLSNTESGTA